MAVHTLIWLIFRVKILVNLPLIMQKGYPANNFVSCTNPAKPKSDFLQEVRLYVDLLYGNATRSFVNFPQPNFY